MLKNENNKVFGKPVFEFIDSGKLIEKQYLSFLINVKPSITVINSIVIKDQTILIGINDSKTVIKISTPLAESFIIPK